MVSDRVDYMFCLTIELASVKMKGITEIKKINKVN